MNKIFQTLITPPPNNEVNKIPNQISEVQIISQTNLQTKSKSEKGNQTRWNHMKVKPNQTPKNPIRTKKPKPNFARLIHKNNKPTLNSKLLNQISLGFKMLNSFLDNTLSSSHVFQAICWLVSCTNSSYCLYIIYKIYIIYTYIYIFRNILFSLEDGFMKITEKKKKI